MSKLKEAGLPATIVNVYPESRFRTHYNKLPITGIVCNTMPHMTTPGESMTIKEIYERFANGMPEDVKQVIYYEGDNPDIDVEDDLLAGRQWDTFDIVEKLEIIKNANRDFKKISTGINEARRKKGEELQKQREEEAAEKKRMKEFYEKHKKSGAEGTD